VGTAARRPYFNEEVLATSKERDEGHAASNLEKQCDGEGRTPPRRIEMAMTWPGGVYPFWPCRNGKEDSYTTGRVYPTCRVEMARTIRPGGVRPSLSHQNGNDDATGVYPFAMSKWKGRHDEERRTPPHRIEVATTRQGAYPRFIVDVYLMKYFGHGAMSRS